MAKIKSVRLTEKYGTDNIHARKYQTLMTEVLTNNMENISRAVSRQSARQWDKGLDKIATKEKRFILPNIQEVLPKRSVFVSKSVEKGKFITDTLKDRLTKDLRDSLSNFTTKTGQPAFIRRTGKLAGTINPKVIKHFQASITNTFSTYTKRDPVYGMPGNIHNIAVTEVRTTVNTMKYEYIKQLLQKNTSILKISKRWRQNKTLSINPRHSHNDANGQTVDFNQPFEINHYRKIKGVERFSRKIYCMHPHDQRLPLNELIGCNCDFEIIARRV